jgi:hypothetical protein
VRATDRRAAVIGDPLLGRDVLQTRVVALVDALDVVRRVLVVLGDDPLLLLGDRDERVAEHAARQQQHCHHGRDRAPRLRPAGRRDG